MHNVILQMNVETFLSLLEMVYDKLVLTMERCVDLCEQIVNSFRAGYENNPPNVLMDLEGEPWISCGGGHIEKIPMTPSYTIKATLAVRRYCRP
ncbi:hypothetical protein EYZ11_001580 [Aspergillus tanneri]|uniref:Uncharacterized protein n=1 Tax=Aspergillus tanneri TaxID=1220188 RepID=A0A4S3JSV9_9EURO|nr:uncharacterized protein ATNIH1004_004511 [Aspergillus tanneri]KAA8648626.1 hypothetical protein ATNIH1004_004511 [Aspergillus tanneri]THC98943.1 hypothetical protein EYZ11_001580 [Aspergillus tanneri]